jgi:hypothetical protein
MFFPNHPKGRRDQNILLPLTLNLILATIQKANLLGTVSLIGPLDPENLPILGRGFHHFFDQQVSFKDFWPETYSILFGIVRQHRIKSNTLPEIGLLAPK